MEFPDLVIHNGRDHINIVGIGNVIPYVTDVRLCGCATEVARYLTWREHRPGCGCTFGSCEVSLRRIGGFQQAAQMRLFQEVRLGHIPHLPSAWHGG